MPNRNGIIVNGYDLGQIGVTTESDLSGWRDSLTGVNRITTLPERAGAVALARPGEYEPRRIVVSVVQHASTLEQLKTWADELKARLSEAVLEVEFGDRAGRVFFAILDGGVSINGIPPALIQKAHRARFTLLCQDAQGYERDGTVVDFTAAKVECPQGTGVSVPLIRIAGPVTNPVVTYRDARGTSIQTLGLTATIAADQWRDIDCELHTIVDQAGANKISELTSGDFIAIDAHDSAGESGPYATLEVSPTPQLAQASYRRAWI